MIQLTDTEYDFLKTTLTRYLPTATCYVFGSRVKGTAQPYSDVDILVKSAEAIPLSVLSKLNEAFDENYLPFKVDIVDWNRITPEFQKVIQSEWVALEAARRYL